MTSVPPPEKLEDLLRLHLISGVGPRTRQSLLERFGSAAAALQAAPSALRTVPGIGPKLCEKIVAAGAIDVDREIALCREHGVQIITEQDEAYPRALREVDDPPGVIFVRGQLLPSDTLAVAIVGTRHPTAYGVRQAERLAASLARAGLVIVSGLARGVDAAAHRAALAAGGRTIAVLASGVLNVYPPEHTAMADEIAAAGAIVSESPPTAVPLAGSFPQRNRIISGMSLGVLVIEAGDRSGALITARHAMEQGRDVFALPGSVETHASRGCHRLIRDGATLVESADDVLETLGPLVEAATRHDGQVIHHPAELMLNEIEQQVLQCVGSEPTTLDEVVIESGLPAPQVLAAITVLEMRRLVRRTSGNSVARPL